MSTRRSRPPRSRKTPAAEPAQTDVAVLAPQTPLMGTLPGHRHEGALDPTQTSQLRALEAGWDELLS